MIRSKISFSLSKKNENIHIHTFIYIYICAMCGTEDPTQPSCAQELESELQKPQGFIFQGWMLFWFLFCWYVFSFFLDTSKFEVLWFCCSFLCFFINFDRRS